jgi:hypothetical protein
MKDEASEARDRIGPFISSGVLNRPIGAFPERSFVQRSFRRADAAGAQAVGADVAGAMSRRDEASEADDVGLRVRVVGSETIQAPAIEIELRVQCDDAENRDDRDDVAPARPQHLFHEELGYSETTRAVHRHRGFPILAGISLGVSRQLAHSVVHKRIDDAHFRARCLTRPYDALLLRELEREQNRLTSGLDDAVGSRLAFLAIACGTDDSGSAFRERFADRDTDRAPRPGHESDTPVQAEQLSDGHPRHILQMPVSPGGAYVPAGRRRGQGGMGERSSYRLRRTVALVTAIGHCSSS